MSAPIADTGPGRVLADLSWIVTTATVLHLHAPRRAAARSGGGERVRNQIGSPKARLTELSMIAPVAWLTASW